MVNVFLNSKYIGKVEDLHYFVDGVKDLRRKGQLPHDVSVSFDVDLNEVYLWSDSGRAIRPLIIVKDGKPLLTPKHISQLEAGELTWGDLVHQGVIEYLDAAEEENAYVAYDESMLTLDHQYLEIAKSGLVGLMTGTVPYANHTPGARILGGAKLTKQALGFYAANFNLRLDMDSSLLHYPQSPLVKSEVHDAIHYDKHPSGQNFIVAVMTHDGYSMEDALVINGGSIQRGLGRSTYFRPVQAEELRYSGGLIDEISIPEEDVKGYRKESVYSHLEGDGIVSPESNLLEGDVVIGRTSPPKFLSAMEEYNLSAATRRESSISLKHGEKGKVDFVILTENEEGNKSVHVRLREQRVPELGDKFASRHGQKGVIGKIVDPSDMPFTQSGITPDIMFTPHGIPSRMSVSHLIECLAGKVASLRGKPVDATIFEGEPEEKLRQELLSMGFREDGTETFYDGRSGRKLKAKIFIGSNYYFKLKYMAAGKLQSRARGPIALLTRQPTEGKAKEGGLRLGEMEKDTFVAHGASLLLKERFDADKTVVPICERTGLIGYYDMRRHGVGMSPIYNDSSKVFNVEMSYAFKLLLDEIKCLGIYPKLELENKY